VPPPSPLLAETGFFKPLDKLCVQVLSLYASQNLARVGPARVVVDDHQVVSCCIEVRIGYAAHLLNNGFDILPMLLVQKFIDVHYDTVFYLAAA
jgi:hypothetical protein